MQPDPISKEDRMALAFGFVSHGQLVFIGCETSTLSQCIRSCLNTSKGLGECILLKYKNAELMIEPSFSIADVYKRWKEKNESAYE